MENVIVTGANGFIGKTLVNALLAKGCRVTALDVRFDDVLADDPRVTCISVLNKDVPALAKEIPAADYHCFFHLAWAGTSGPARADYDVQLSNVKLTCDYIKLCAEVGCKRLVYASSINEMETYEYLQSDDIDPAGGYIYGFLPMAALCGLGTKMPHRVLAIVLGVAGLAACHLCGTIQFGIISGNGPWAAFLVASVPYLVKDIVSVAAAYGVATALSFALKKSGIHIAA